jgi:aminoglycoside 6'-N-acetyltransferase
MTPASYQFRPMNAGDLPLVRDWLSAPHVAEWWHDGDDFEFVSGDLDHHDMGQFIVSHADRPFAYLQCYRMGDWHAGFGPQPSGTRGLDQFIADKDMIGCGHGSAFIRSFSHRLLKSVAPRIVLDPKPANARAIRAYEKAGFTRAHEIETPDGRALLMVRDA